MLCESCGKRDANVHLTHVADDVAREVHLCEKCAAKSGINIEGPMSLSAVLMGLGALDEMEPGASKKTCPLCRMTLSDFKKTSLLGCPVCYETFEAELTPLLAGIHKGGKHEGKVPSYGADDLEGSRRIAPLQRKLEGAIAAEDYEEAARLRDTIRLEKGDVAEPLQE